VREQTLVKRKGSEVLMCPGVRCDLKSVVVGVFHAVNAGVIVDTCP
jgi:hypothetical protein